MLGSWDKNHYVGSNTILTSPVYSIDENSIEFKQAFSEGNNANHIGQSKIECPYPFTGGKLSKRDAWQMGWDLFEHEAYL